jgi:uncharacterized protein (DUF1501 family)
MCAAGLVVSGFGSRLVFAQDSMSTASRPLRLVVVFLFGGADPLTLFPPVGDDEYYRCRPTLAIGKNEATKLDGIFGLHSFLNPLFPYWQNGEMTIVHQFGLKKTERSHMTAGNLMQKGIGEWKDVPQDGFLSRAILEKFGSSRKPLRSISISSIPPEILNSSAGTIGMQSLSDLAQFDRSDEELEILRGMAENGGDRSLKTQSAALFAAIHQIRTSSIAREIHEGKIHQQAPGLNSRLGDVAKLIRAELGLQVAFVSSAGWDTHARQQERLSPLIQDLGTGLASFGNDLKKSGHWKDTLVVVMTEFGRVAMENGSQGSDHGHGSAALLMGGALPAKVGGKVLHHWKSLKTADLSEGRDLPVEFDYRDVMSEVLMTQLALNQSQLSRVFPSHPFRQVGIFT